MKLITPTNALPGAGPFYFEGSKQAVLLIHGGGGGSASDMKELGAFIHNQLGYTVYAPLLPGYGTTKEDLHKTQLDDWLSFLKQELQKLKTENEKIYLVGHSMGGVFALFLAGEFAEDVAAVVSICAPTRIKGLLIKLVPFFKIFVKYWKQNDEAEFKRVSNGLWVGYEKIPLNMVGKFKNLFKLNNAQLHRITAPITIISGSRDEFVPEESAQFIYDHVNSAIKSKKQFDSDHAILFSKVKSDMFSYITEFLDAH
jgi:carboxylesterase